MNMNDDVKGKSSFVSPKFYLLSSSYSQPLSFFLVLSLSLSFFLTLFLSPAFFLSLSLSLSLSFSPSPSFSLSKVDRVKNMLWEYLIYGAIGVILAGGVGATPVKGTSIGRRSLDLLLLVLRMSARRSNATNQRSQQQRMNSMNV